MRKTIFTEPFQCLKEAFLHEWMLKSLWIPLYCLLSLSIWSYNLKEQIEDERNFIRFSKVFMNAFLTVFRSIWIFMKILFQQLSLFTSEFIAWNIDESWFVGTKKKKAERLLSLKTKSKIREMFKDFIVEICR